jgi:hypothetical protein
MFSISFGLLMTLAGLTSRLAMIAVYEKCHNTFRILGKQTSILFAESHNCIAAPAPEHENDATPVQALAPTSLSYGKYSKNSLHT